MTRKANKPRGPKARGKGKEQAPPQTLAEEYVASNGNKGRYGRRRGPKR